MSNIDSATTRTDGHRSLAVGTSLALAGFLAMTQAEPLRAASLQPLRVGDPLPRVQGSFLTGRDARPPEASAGKTTLLLLGFTYESRHAVEAWGAWCRKAVRIGISARLLGDGPLRRVWILEQMGGFPVLGVGWSS